MSDHVDMIIAKLLRLSNDGTTQFDSPYTDNMARVTATVPFEGAPLLVPSPEDRVNEDPRMAGKIQVGAIVLSKDRDAYHISARVLGLDAETPSDMVAS